MKRAKLNAKKQVRAGFTLVELLVVISIIGILIGLLLPAVNAAREAARKASCANNMRQVASAALNYEVSLKKLPNGGEGTQYNGLATAPSTWFCDSAAFKTQYPNDPHCGTFVQILPYLEGSPVYKQINKDLSYRDDANTVNPADPNDVNYGSHAKISAYVCPSNPMQGIGDPYNYGQVDYFATVYTDIDPVSGKRLNNQTMSGGPGPATATDPWARVDGALALPAAPISAISDGTSNTIMFVEDSGRTHATLGYRTASRYADPACTGAAGAMATDCTGTPGDQGAGGIGGANFRAVNRWADPDATGSGVSGPHQDTSAAYVALVAGSNANIWRQFANQNSNPNGGPTTCPWTLNNCGMNDEPFAWHPGGCNASFVDGSVHFLGVSIDPKVMRALVTRSEGVAASIPE